MIKNNNLRLKKDTLTKIKLKKMKSDSLGSGNSENELMSSNKQQELTRKDLKDVIDLFLQTDKFPADMPLIVIINYCMNG